MVGLMVEMNSLGIEGQSERALICKILLISHLQKETPPFGGALNWLRGGPSASSSFVLGRFNRPRRRPRGRLGNLNTRPSGYEPDEVHSHYHFWK
jgi:hypothetical protein